MADDIAQRITALAPLPVVAADDVFPVVDDPDGIGKKTKKVKTSAVNINLVRTAKEITAGVTPTNFLYPTGFIDRNGAALNTDSTAAFETAVASIGRLNIRFAFAGRTLNLNDFSEFYILRDAFVAGNSIIGPANFASDGTQVESILRLGRDPDHANGMQWRYRTVYGITFSGKLRADNAISFGDDDNFPNNQDTSWHIDKDHFERCNKGIIKQHGNFGQTITRCSFSSGNYGYWAQGYPIQTVLDVAEAFGQTVLSVANTVGINDLDEVRILMDDASTHESTIASVDHVNGTITINDATDDTAAEGNFVKIYHPDFAVPVTLSHLGSDTLQKNNFGGHYKAAIYLDGQQVQGTGGTALRDDIIEQNPGFGIFIRDYNTASVPLSFYTVWFEANAKDADTYNIDPDAICLSQTPSGAGNFTLNGVSTSGGVYSADPVNSGARQLSFTSASNESADTYTITGTDVFGVAQVENISGPNATTVFSVNSFDTVTQIATDGAATGAITIGITGMVDLADGFGLREPQDIYFENVDSAYITGSLIRIVTFIDSFVRLDQCKLQFAETEFIITNTNNLNNLRITNAIIEGWGESAVGAKLVEIESIFRILRHGGEDVNRCWRSPQRIPTKGFEVAGGTVLETDRGDSGQDWLGVSADPDVARDGYVAGLSYPTASQYTFLDGDDYLAPAVMAAASTTAGKWYAMTLEILVDSGLANISSIKWGGAYNFTRGNANDLLIQGEWATIANVAQLQAGNSGAIRPQITMKTGGGSDDAQISIGASQFEEFDDAQDAYDFYNKGIHINQVKTSKRVKRTSNPTRATTTALADDPDLLGWNLQKDTWYKVKGFFVLDTNTTADFKWQFVFTNSPQTIAIIMESPLFGGAAEQASEASVNFPGATADQTIITEGIFQANATTGGSVDFQWAQQTSDAYATRIEEGSHITISKLFDED